MSRKQQVFKSISLSTIACWTEDISTALVTSEDACRTFDWYSIALDDSIDVSNSAQVFLNIRGISRDLEITEELADVYSMENKVTGVKTFIMVN